ncbi:unnamed protein product [Rodentolepis nana]|uniref:Uncharacterized protein n=1 Tax=Rodentolepis nana TaxID=102285 RepID=A0A3P7S793_RODNA|nr:unnamed protein product [Rodentolepis nana]
MSIANLLGDSNGNVDETITPPTTRKDAHQLGQVCLVEALHWAQQAFKTIEQAPDLNQELDIKNFIGKDITK